MGIYIGNQKVNFPGIKKIFFGPDEVFTQYYTVSFSVNESSYGSWNDSTAISVPADTVVSKSGNTVTFSYNGETLYTRTLNVNSNTRATSSAKTGYTYSSEIVNNETITNNSIISGNITRTDNSYWVSFTASGGGTVSPSGVDIDAGASVSTDGRYWKAGNSTKCTGTANGNSSSSSTSTGSTSRTNYTYTYSYSFSSWSLTSGTINEPKSVTCNFSSTLVNTVANWTDYLVTVSHPSPIVNLSGTYSNVSVSKSTLYGIKVADSSGNAYVDRLTRGSETAWIRSGTRVYLYGYTSTSAFGNWKPSFTINKDGNRLSNGTAPVETTSITEWRGGWSTTIDSACTFTMGSSYCQGGTKYYTSCSGSLESCKGDGSASGSWTLPWTTGYATGYASFGGGSNTNVGSGTNGGGSSGTSLPKGSNGYTVSAKLASYSTSSATVSFWKSSGTAIRSYSGSMSADAYPYCP